MYQIVEYGNKKRLRRPLKPQFIIIKANKLNQFVCDGLTTTLAS